MPGRDRCGTLFREPAAFSSVVHPPRRLGTAQSLLGRGLHSKLSSVATRAPAKSLTERPT